MPFSSNYADKSTADKLISDNWFLVFFDVFPVGWMQVDHYRSIKHKVDK